MQSGDIAPLNTSEQTGYLLKQQYHNKETCTISNTTNVKILQKL
jgi:hypothetical protein